MSINKPLAWRHSMQSCDCCDRGQICGECAWHEGIDNPPEVHEAHLAHIRAWREEQSADDLIRYRYARQLE